MHATVAAEGEDAADALSRSYSYVNQRLVRYVAHVAIAWAIGAVGLLAASSSPGSSSGWPAGASASGPRTRSADRADAGRRARLLGRPASAWLVHGWIYSYFWSAASIIYLILRRDVDGADWHDVYLPEHEADTFAGPPPPPEVGLAAD